MLKGLEFYIPKFLGRSIALKRNKKGHIEI